MSAALALGWGLPSSVLLCPPPHSQPNPPYPLPISAGVQARGAQALKAFATDPDNAIAAGELGAAQARGTDTNSWVSPRYLLVSAPTHRASQRLLRRICSLACVLCSGSNPAPAAKQEEKPHEFHNTHTRPLTSELKLTLPHLPTHPPSTHPYPPTTQAVAAALWAHSDDPDVAEQCCAALGSLAVDAGNQERIAQVRTDSADTTRICADTGGSGRGVPPLRDGLLRWRCSRPPCGFSPSVAPLQQRRGGFPIFSASLEHPKRTTPNQPHNLYTHNPTTQAGALEVLLGALKTHLECDAVQREGTEALANLAFLPQNLVRFFTMFRTVFCVISCPTCIPTDIRR